MPYTSKPRPIVCYKPTTDKTRNNSAAWDTWITLPELPAGFYGAKVRVAGVIEAGGAQLSTFRLYHATALVNCYWQNYFDAGVYPLATTAPQFMLGTSPDIAGATVTFCFYLSAPARLELQVAQVVAEAKNHQFDANLTELDIVKVGQV